MAFMNWSDRYSVGIKLIDDQHMVLLSTVNDLHTAMKTGQAQSVAGQLLRTLVKYTVDHFATEERLMKSVQYPELQAHQRQHHDLTQQVDEFVKRFEKGDVTLSIGLLNFLSDWLATHILKDDKKYGPFLNAHGIK